MRLDVLFVVPGHLASAYQGLAAEHALEPPAMARLIAAYLMRRMVSVAFVDANTDKVSAEADHRLTPQETAVLVRDADPRVVVVPVYGYNPSSSTQTMPAARAYAQAIKDLVPGVPILFTGTHPAALPERTLREEPIDLVCDGEGPVTVHELVLALRAGGDLRKVRSLWYRDEGAIAHNDPAPNITLAEEPALPAWVHMDPRKYCAHDWHTFWRDYPERFPYANPLSEFGCPKHCNFCNIQAPFKAGERFLKMAPSTNSYRRLPPQMFVDEVTYLAETFGVRYFKIPDEMFVLHPEHVLAIAKGVRARFGPDDLNFWSYARVDTTRTEFLEPLREMGMRWVGLGIEAADDRVRSDQDKAFSGEKIFDVVERIRRAGINVGANYIFGLPGETRESMQATYDLAVALNTPFANMYCAMALPGSALHRKAMEDGYPLPERPDGPGWAGYAQYSVDAEPYVTGGDLTPAEVLEFRDNAWRAYFTRPEYEQSLLTDPAFGETALRNIRAWIHTPLRRRIVEGRNVLS